MAESKVGRAISAEVPSGSDAPITFDQVLKREVERLNKSRDKRKIDVPARSDNLTGLAFSGGGIRSATFNLGVLQALAQRGLLQKFDYLSTVSGGGYVGSWLAAFTKRRTDPPEGSTCPAGTFADVQDALSPHRYEADRRSEPPVLHWLRLYSNYLTPDTGVVSGDTWAMLGTWLRNVILNQTILGLMFISVFVLCQSALQPMVNNPDANGWKPLIGGMTLLFLAAISMAINVVQEVPSRAIFQTFFRRIKVTATVMVPFVIACVLLNCGLWLMSNEMVEVPIWQWALGGAVFYFAVWGIVAIMAAVRRLLRRRREKPVKRMVSIPALLIYSPIAGAVGACLLRAYTLVLNQPQNWDSGEWVIVVFGSGAVMITVLLVGTLHLGLVGRGSMDVVREWWARLGGYLMLITLGWLLLAGTCAFAPLGVRWVFYELKGWKSVTAALLWVLHNYFGLKAATSSKTNGQGKDDANGKKSSSNGDEGGSWITRTLKSPAFLNALAKVAPYVFLVGLVLLLATAVHIAIGLVFDPSETVQLWHFNNLGWAVLYGKYWNVLKSAPALWLLGLGAGFFLAGLGLSWRVDVNEFSLHHFYRNRLVRCYLGASNADRKAEPFTGFDPGDDLPMCSFDDNYPGPYPILNAALNITGGEELGYATRRAKSFIFTPLYCGYELGSSGEGVERFTCGDGFLRSYSKTELGRTESRWGKLGSESGISLGTAMAISGAAASPNMGYHTSPATAFFMTLFDVRLGWWMANPRNPKKWPSTGPQLGLGYLFSEVFANCDQQRGYVYLSDGGHFENLAVYELIRRRCRLIVACDADADGAYQFSDLLSLIEKARTDFGARIEIKFQDIQPPVGSRECPQTCVVGTIYYDPKDATDIGTLIVVKASMPGRSTPPCSTSDRKLPDDVWRYFDQHLTFPHQSTADQWFDELQFESYRALGEYIGCQASGRIGDALDEALAQPKPAQAEAVPATAITV